MRLESAICTHIGRRSNNEDNFLLTDRGLFVVADGMGGYEGGEVASAIVVRSVERFVARGVDGDATWPTGIDPTRTFEENELAAALALANREVCKRKQGKLALMGATVVALLVRDDRIAVAHVGDSRAYRLRSGRLEQLTRDHSLVAELEANGVAPPRAGDFSHVVTRAIGMGETARADVRSDSLEAGDVYLLCSDGLSDVLPDVAIEQLLSSDPVASVRALVQAAVDAGGSDNITALVVSVRCT